MMSPRLSFDAAGNPKPTGTAQPGGARDGQAGERKPSFSMHGLPPDGAMDANRARARSSRDVVGPGGSSSSAFNPNA